MGEPNGFFAECDCAQKIGKKFGELSAVGWVSRDMQDGDMFAFLGPNSASVGRVMQCDPVAARTLNAHTPR